MTHWEPAPILTLSQLAAPSRTRPIDAREGNVVQQLLRIARWIDQLNEYVGRFMTGVVLLMVLIGVWNVIGRYVGQAIGQNLS